MTQVTVFLVMFSDMSAMEYREFVSQYWAGMLFLVNTQSFFIREISI